MDWGELVLKEGAPDFSPGGSTPLARIPRAMPVDEWWMGTSPHEGLQGE